MPFSHEEKILFLAAKPSLSEDDQEALDNLCLQKTDWKLLLELARAFNLLPLVARNLLTIDNNLIPKKTIQSLSQFYQREYTIVNLALWDEFKDLNEKLRAKNIPSIPFKGIVNAELLYNNLGFRRTSDVDIIIRKEDLPALEDTVREMGYREDPREEVAKVGKEKHLKREFHLSFVKNTALGKLVTLNLHWDILPKERRIANLMDDFWKDSDREEISGIEITFLSLEDTLFSCLIELYKDLIDHKAFLLKRCLDIRQVLQLYGTSINWEDFITRAYRYRINVLAYFAFLLTEALFTEHIASTDLLNRLRPPPCKKNMYTWIYPWHFLFGPRKEVSRNILLPYFSFFLGNHITAVPLECVLFLLGRIYVPRLSLC